MKHKLELRHNGETSREESAWTARCVCGHFEESCHRKEDARREYSRHLKNVRKPKCEHCKDTGLYDACCRPHLCDCEAGREKKFQEWAGFDGTGWEP